MKQTSTFLFIFFCTVTAAAQDGYVFKENISYIRETDTDTYRQERCQLDLYYPAKIQKFPTLVWFHGGGLTSGGKSIPQELKNKGIAVVAANYRLSPAANNPAYTVDAAEATAWVFKNIEQFGGDAKKIFVSGHSAGGYLTLMIGTDKRYLAAYGIDADQIKGLIPVSGQTNTHYTIRKERGLPIDIPVIDEYAPINKVRKGMPPTLLITGGRTLEMLARYEENLHFEAIMKSVNNDVQLYELQGFDHGSVVVPAYALILKFISKHSKNE